MYRVVASTHTFSKGGIMTNIPEEKWQTDWKSAAEKYCARLEEAIEELRKNTDSVPASNILNDLVVRSEEIQRAGQCFRDDVKRTIRTAPEPPSKPFF